MEERLIENGDITLRVEVTGDGPTVLFVHGWPELSHSWRHQVAHFAERGYRCAALDVRGYGGSSNPTQIERYALRELAGDVAAVAAALSDEPVVLVGHDWGAPIVWHTAIRHPERVRGVAGLSVPHTPPLPISLLDLFDQIYANRFFYMLHFQQPGVVEAEFAQDLRGALKKVYFALSAAGPRDPLVSDLPRDTPITDVLPEPPAGPLSFLSDDDLDVYVRAFERSGTTGGFNRYRALALEVDDTADILGATVDRPSWFIGGEFDVVRTMIPGADSYADPGAGCTDHRGTTIVPGAGHWVQQENPVAVNAALEAFLATL
jgi:pimeloyl-ACP methyl ester carboxylesterase